MAAVLLRRLFTTTFDDFWPQLTPEAQASLKQELLMLVQEEKSPELSKKIAECLAEFSKNMLGKLFCSWWCLIPAWLIWQQSSNYSVIVLV